MTVWDSQGVTSTPFVGLLDAITSVVDYSREFGISSGNNALDIRLSGQDALKHIVSTENMSPSEKADSLRAAAAQLSEHLNLKPDTREYRALSYVIRIFKARASIIRDTIDTFSQIF